jgi:outer membrane protein OmpU
MNKLTKLGVSALAGSLAAVSAANAGELTVTGGVDMSWISLEDDTTGNPIGMGSNLTFSGSGELDNGWSVALSVAHDNKNAYSNTNVTVTVPSLGDIRIDQGVSGTGIDRIDDITPNVWEEADGTGLGTGIQKVRGVSGGANIEYTPNMLPDGLVAKIAYSPETGGAGANDKGSTVHYGAEQSGWDITLKATDAIHGVAGLTFDFGMSEITQDATNSAISGDQEEQTIAVTYAVGGFTLGYQMSEQDLGSSGSVPKQYDNEMYGITFNINDDLSVGYNNIESDQDNDTDVETTAESIQIAYSMGGASLRLAQASVDNAKYQTSTLYDRDATTLSVSLAF